MKRIISGPLVSASLVIILSVVLLGLVPAAYAANCSTATVAGNWAFTLTGTLILPTGGVPAAAIARATADNNGNISGTEARSVGGDYADETVDGAWTVNSDCTGTLTVNAYELGQLVRTSVVSIVFDDNSKEVRMVQKSLTLPDGTQLPVVITLEGRKQSGGMGEVSAAAAPTSGAPSTANETEVAASSVERYVEADPAFAAWSNQASVEPQSSCPWGNPCGLYRLNCHPCVGGAACYDQHHRLCALHAR